MAPRLRVGLIGCGFIAQAVHLKILNRMPNVELVAIAEPDPARRENAHAKVKGARAFSDQNQLLEIPDLQAVVICLPTVMHAQAAKAVLAKRLHIYLEKPLAANIADAQQLIQQWRNLETIGMIGFNYRFHPLHQAAKNQIEAGKLGKLQAIRSAFHAFDRNLPEWKKARATGGGALLDLGSHHIDLIQFITGEKIKNVSCKIQSERTEHDRARLHLELSGEISAESNFSLNVKDEDWMEFQGELGTLRVDRHQTWHLPTHYLLRKILQPRNEPSYQLALQHFVDGAISNRRVQPDFFDGYRCLSIIDAAEESSRSGRDVLIAERD